MVVKVYETMTQDVSDVLANDQLELAKMLEESHRTIIARILELCKELKTIYPPVRFVDYYTNHEEYLRNAFVVPEMPEEEDVDNVKRHLAYHRLQWLQSEFEKMKLENIKLEKRSADLKKQQQEVLKASVRNEVDAEQTHLELTHSHHWNAKAAQEIESTRLAEHVQSEMTRLTVSATSTKRAPLSQTELGSPTIYMAPCKICAPRPDFPPSRSYAIIHLRGRGRADKNCPIPPIPLPGKPG